MRRPAEIEWNGYLPFQQGTDGPWDDLPRREARRLFRQVMAERHERIEALRSLLLANGIVLGTSDDAVEELERWFRLHVEADPTDPSRPRPLWLAVAFDIGVFLGELILSRRPSLRWELFVWGRRAVSYQRPVIMGFDVADTRYYVDPVLTVTADAFAALAGEVKVSACLLLLYAHKAGESDDPREAYRRTRPASR